MNKLTTVLLLFLVGTLVYLQSLTNGFIGDDFDQIVHNQTVHSFSNIPLFFTGSTYENYPSLSLHGLYYRPLMMTTFATLYHIVGRDPFYFHLFQLFVHILNSTGVFFLYLRFFPKKTSLVGALLFLVHPINSETVLYIANTQDVLFFLFGISALLLTLYFLSHRSIILAVFSLLLFSLLSKETGIFFVVAVIVASLFSNKKQSIRVMLSSFTALICYLVIRTQLITDSLQTPIAPIANASLEQRIHHIPSIISYYLTTFFFPKDLAITQFWFYKEPTYYNFYLPALLLCTLIFFTFFAAYQSTHNKKIPLFFLLLLYCGVSLHIHIIPLDMTVAERWFYAPIIGIIGFLLFFISEKIEKKKLYFIFSLLLITILAIRTFQRSLDWKNNLTLYRHDASISKNNFYIENLLGKELIEQGKFKEAKPYIHSSIQNYPYFGNITNMAVIYHTEKNIPKTKEYLEKAFKYTDTYILYENYANFLHVYEDNNTTKEFLTKSIKKYPRAAHLWFLLALTEYEMKNYTAAQHAIDTAYLLDPSDQNKITKNQIHNNLPIITSYSSSQ